MICTPPFTAGPSTTRTRSPASTYTCGGSATNAFTSSPGAIFPFPGPAPAAVPALHEREIYLRALEQEREEILAAAYASKHSSPSTSSSSITSSPSSSPRSTYSPFSTDCSESHDEAEEEEDADDELVSRFDERGRQLTFRETVRQRQARLNFLRRQEFARRLAHRGLEDAKASAYAIKRLPPPKVRPIERVNAAIKIQRAYRVHLATRRLREIVHRTKVAHDEFMRDAEREYEDAWRRHAEVLHGLLKELGEITGVISSSTASRTKQGQNQTMHPHVRLAAREAMDALRTELGELDKAQVRRFLTSPTSSADESVAVSITPCESWSDASSYSSASDDEDDNEDEESEDDDDYGSYIYTPPSSRPSSLYVVDEEDEEEVERFNSQSYSPSFTPNYYSELPKSPQPPHHHQRTRHAPISSSSLGVQGQGLVPVPATLPGLVRSPVSRSPSLASIPEEGDGEY